MNSLSWFLYFADVVHSVAAVLGITSLFISFGILAVAAARAEDGECTFFHTARWLWVPFLGLLLACLIPSKNTLYAIAASQMGEKVVESAIGQKALKAVEVWIDGQLEPKK